MAHTGMRSSRRAEAGKYGNTTVTATDEAAVKREVQRLRGEATSGWKPLGPKPGTYVNGGGAENGF